jgi:hypothetical protein
MSSVIINMLLPKSKQNLRKFLRLIGYCRLWMASYAPQEKYLYSKLLEEESDLLLWKPKEVELQYTLKQDLIIASVLSLLSFEKPFNLFVTVDKGAPLGVLTLENGGQRQPMAFMSGLDSVSRG